MNANFIICDLYEYNNTQKVKYSYSYNDVNEIPGNDLPFKNTAAMEFVQNMRCLS